MTPTTTSLRIAAAMTIAAALVLGVNLSGGADDALAMDPSDEATDGVPVLPDGVLLDPSDTVVLLLDHQTGLLQTVRDIPIQDLRRNTIVLAKVAALAGAPVITTASEPSGPNGPLMPELVTAAPDATYVPRMGEVSAWDNPDFRSTVEATGRRTLVIAGVWTSVCVAFPALQTAAEGYTVYAVVDASGDVSDVAARTAMDRMVEAGVVPMSTNAVMSEFQRTWARPDAAEWAALYSELVPSYRAVTESWEKKRSAASSARGGR